VIFGGLGFRDRPVLRRTAFGRQVFEPDTNAAFVGGNAERRAEPASMSRRIRLMVYALRRSWRRWVGILARVA